MEKVVHLYASQRVSRRAKDGIDGTSVTIISKSVTYQISASGTETPTGNWSDKVVATTDTKPYLWTRTIVVYSDTNSTTSYSVSYKGKDGAPGKDAYRVEASPSTLVFDTNENGVVDVSELSGKYATVTVYKGSQKISVDNLSLPSNYATKKYTNVDGKISNNNGEARITITKIEQEAISGDEKVSKSSGQISFPIDVLGERSTLMWVTVNVQVNVAKFTGSVVANNKKFETKFTEISNRFENTPTNKDLTDAESRITQTAREISLSVSEKTIGRRNLLVGSAARRQGEGWTFMSGDYYNGLPCDSIEINSGYDGVNAIHCRTKQTGTDCYLCGFRWIGTYSPQGNIKLKKGKSYTLSFWAKAYNSGYVNFVSELIWQGSATDNSRPAGYTGPKGFSVTQQATKNNTWTLFKVNIEVPSDASYEYVEVNIFAKATNYTLQDAFICKPMLEEGDYNGWTLSTDDYDYVGGNLLDNTRTLDKSGTLYDVNGALTQAGFGESTSIYKSFVYKLKGIVDSFSQLPSSGNVYGDMYCVRNTEMCYRYNGSKFEDVGNDYYYNILEWRKGKSGAFNPFGLEANKDYVFSFMAKGTGKITAYFYNPDTDVFVESSLGETATRVDGAANFQLTSDWKKYWVHWRPSDSSHRYILLRLNRTIQSSAGDAPITNCYIAQPKLEAGAVVTEYTERKSDLVDKASLKKAGIGITDKEVLLYGEQVKVMNNNAIAALFKNGMLNADLIAAKVLESLGSNGARVVINDGIMEFFGSINKTQPNIRFGLNSEGSAVLSYYDNAGNFLYDLGPDGISTMDKQDGIFTEYSFYTSQNLFGITSIPSSYGTMETFESSQGTVSETFYVANEAYDSHLFPKLNPSRATVTHLYRYHAPRINGKIVADSKNGLTTQELASKADGKYFTSNRNVVFNGNLTNLAVGDFWNIDSAVTNMGNFVSSLLKYGESYTKPTYSRSQQMTLIDGSSELGIVSRICSLETTTQYGGNIHAGWE